MSKGDIQDTIRVLSQTISNAGTLQLPVKCNLCREIVVPGMTACWFCAGEVVCGELEVPVTADFNVADGDSVSRLAARYIASAIGAPSAPSSR